jgi:hypothetical protein
MSNQEAIIAKIQAAFGENDYPGDRYLQGSFDGCEPAEEVGPFQGKRAWAEIEPDFLDAHAAALNFFSEAGLRFFLPAYLVADLRGQLSVADPLFHLTHGFFDETMEYPLGERIFRLKTGKSALVNPRRYGAATFYDYARYRLSVFTREETEAVVVYLQHKRDAAIIALEKERIEAALNAYWLERARTAPSAAELKQYLAEQSHFLAAA